MKAKRRLSSWRSAKWQSIIANAFRETFLRFCSPSLRTIDARLDGVTTWFRESLQHEDLRGFDWCEGDAQVVLKHAA